MVVEGIPAVSSATKVPIFGRVIGEDVGMVEGTVTPVFVEIGIAMVAHTVIDIFKSPKGVVACKGCACEDDCEEVELARAIDLPLLKCIHKQLGVFSNKVTHK